MATNYIAITDLTDTVLIANGTAITSYLLERDAWGPSVASLSRSKYANKSAYDMVEEQIPLSIKGTSAADAYSKLEVLKRLLDQAELWASGVFVPPVFFQFAPQGSTISSDTLPLTAIIIGRANGDTTNSTTLPQEFSESANTYIIRNVDVRFTRKGLLSIGTSAASATAASAANIVTTAAITTAKTLSPTKIDLSNYNSTASGFLVVTNNANKITIANAESMGFTLDQGVANNAPTALGSRITILRASDVAAQPNVSIYGSTSISSMRSYCNYVYVFVSLRVTGVASWIVWASNGSDVPIETKRQPISPSTNPKVICLGLMNIEQITTLRVYCTTASALTTDRIEMDYVCIADSDAFTFTLFARSGTQARSSLIIDHRYLTNNSSNLLLGTQALSYRGNTFITTTGTAISACLIATDGAYWRPYDTGSSTVLTHVLTATRLTSYVTPQ